MSDDLVERVARVLEPYVDSRFPYPDPRLSSAARAAIDAIKAAGWRPPSPDYQPRGPQWLAEMKPPFAVGSQQQPETD